MIQELADNFCALSFLVLALGISVSLIVSAVRGRSTSNREDER